MSGEVELQPQDDHERDGVGGTCGENAPHHHGGGSKKRAHRRKNENAPAAARTIASQLDLEDKLTFLSGHSLWELPGGQDLKHAEIRRRHKNHRKEQEEKRKNRMRIRRADEYVDEEDSRIVPRILLCDGPHGVRKPVSELGLKDAFPATCFPTACALACSWNPALLENVVGPALSTECYKLGVSILLGPGMNLKRHPAGGRNFEYFSEDPLLSGRMAAAFVRGVQSSGKTGACMKHFAVNNQESHRFVVNAVVDERTLRELYYRNFEIAVRESKPASIMCAYNRINGVFASEDPNLYRVLRTEWSADRPVVMTDWGATNVRSDGIRAGVDLEMPGSHGLHAREIRAALEREDERGVVDNDIEEAGDANEGYPGLLSSQIETSAVRVLELIETYKGAALHYHRKHRHETAAATSTMPLGIDFDRHHELAYQAALDCVVLLRNENNCLPLRKESTGTRSPSVALIGAFGKGTPRFQGMGSSQVNCARRPATLFDELQRHIDRNDIHFAPGYKELDEDDDDDDDGISDAMSLSLLNEAVELAKRESVDVVLLSIGLPEILESEGFDRTTLEIPSPHIRLLEAVCDVHSNVVVILSNGGAIQLPDSCLRASAILEGYLLGQAGAAAVADLLFGVASPSGKLSETMPLRKEDIPADRYFPGSRDVVEHREGLDVGYRYFHTVGKPVRFPFGHGLSYTTFEYSDLQLEVLLDEPETKKVRATFAVSNTGAMMASEVVQCYVHDVDVSVYRPVHELREFSKVSLKVGERKTISFDLETDAFSYYDIGHTEWVVEPGKFDIRIGSSSCDIRLNAEVEFRTGIEATKLAQLSYPPRSSGNHSDIDINDELFAQRFGNDSATVLEEILNRGRDEEGSTGLFHRNSLLKEVSATRIGAFLRYIVYKEASKEIQAGPAQNRQKKLIRENVDNLPLRTLALFSKGTLSFETLDALIAAMNGHYCASLRHASKACREIFADTISAICGAP